MTQVQTPTEDRYIVRGGLEAESGCGCTEHCRRPPPQADQPFGSPRSCGTATAPARRTARLRPRRSSSGRLSLSKGANVRPVPGSSVGVSAAAPPPRRRSSPPRRSLRPTGHAELASWSASSREAVAKALQLPRELSWIETHRRRILAPDLDPCGSTPADAWRREIQDGTRVRAARPDARKPGPKRWHPPKAIPRAYPALPGRHSLHTGREPRSTTVGRRVREGQCRRGVRVPLSP
jgi:hypothetical protein